ncbi:MAG: EamA family transporter, partial [Inconstantimicrobium porci]|nr:EamA family transporter [Inconstantimicrobium porci]
LAGACASIGQFGVTFAYKYAQAKEISIFDYTNILFSAVISIIVFNVIPDGMSVIGYLVIFVASFNMFRFNKNLDKIEKKAKES